MILYPHFPGGKKKSEGNKVEDPILKILQNWNSTSIRHPRAIPDVYMTPSHWGFAYTHTHSSTTGTMI